MDFKVRNKCSSIQCKSDRAHKVVWGAQGLYMKLKPRAGWKPEPLQSEL